MAHLIVTHGAPGSGKSTKVAEMVKQRGVGKAIRVGKDPLRRMFACTSDEEITPWTNRELNNAVMRQEKFLVQDLLKQGHDVFVDDTNIPLKVIREWRDLAYEVGATFEVLDFSDVPLNTLLHRNTQRRDVVEKGVIKKMHQSLRSQKSSDLRKVAEGFPVSVEPVDNDPSLPDAIIVDMDGTLAHMTGRGPFEWSRVGEDEPDAAVVAAVEMVHKAGVKIIIMSGREDVCRTETEEWLAAAVDVEVEGIFMRAAGDGRKDSVVKRELFKKNVEGKYHVLFCLDDRNQVVEAWRNMGLKVFQVQEGDF